jgi:hypothetical protein
MNNANWELSSIIGQDSDDILKEIAVTYKSLRLPTEAFTKQPERIALELGISINDVNTTMIDTVISLYQGQIQSTTVHAARDKSKSMKLSEQRFDVSPLTYYMLADTVLNKPIGHPQFSKQHAPRSPKFAVDETTYKTAEMRRISKLINEFRIGPHARAANFIEYGVGWVMLRNPDTARYQTAFNEVPFLDIQFDAQRTFGRQHRNFQVPYNVYFNQRFIDSTTDNELRAFIGMLVSLYETMVFVEKMRFTTKQRATATLLVTRYALSITRNPQALYNLLYKGYLFGFRLLLWGSAKTAGSMDTSDIRMADLLENYGVRQGPRPLKDLGETVDLSKINMSKVDRLVQKAIAKVISFTD